MQHLPKTIQKLEQALIRELQEIPQATLRGSLRAWQASAESLFMPIVTIHTTEKLFEL